MPSFRRYFTLAEANALIPSVLGRLEAARGHAQRFRELMDALRAGRVTKAERAPRAKEAEEARRAVLAVVEELGDQGVEVKGIDEGLVDFPALYQGREVYLCWKLGEPSIGWWHPIHTGVGGRQPIDPTDEGWNLWN